MRVYNFSHIAQPHLIRHQNSMCSFEIDYIYAQLASPSAVGLMELALVLSSPEAKK